MSDITTLLHELHPLEVTLLRELTDKDSFDFNTHAALSELNEGQLRQALGWLLAKGSIQLDKDEHEDVITVTERGELFAQQGSPETGILSLLTDGNTYRIPDIQKKLSAFEKKDIGSAIGALKESNTITMGEGGSIILQSSNIAETDFAHFDSLLKKLSDTKMLLKSKLNTQEIDLLEKLPKQKGSLRGTIKIKTTHNPYYSFTQLGKELRSAAQTADLAAQEIGQLTVDHLKSTAWKNASFRRYNLGLPPPRIIAGKKNAYREYLDELKRAFCGLGFEEMRGSIVESEFWDMDALFMPQFHSARNIHDAYYIKEPTHTASLQQPYCDAVIAAHENGGTTGSTGWQYTFNKEKSKKLVLRTQGTVLSVRMLSSQPKIPGKYFAIARCFRPDVVDATHLADFNQVEGIVLGDDITFRHLLGLLELFAVEIARAKDIKFVPAYFPFTEPSVEIHIKHPVIGWMEMGGAGLFRPEVTHPQGINTPVIAWGLGVDRMAMMALGINDIRDLFSNDLTTIRETRVED